MVGKRARSATTKTQKMNFHDFVGSSSLGRIFRSNALKVMKIEDLTQNRLSYNLVYDLFHFENINTSSRVYTTKCIVGNESVKVYHSNSSFFHYKMSDLGSINAIKSIHFGLFIFLEVCTREMM